MKASVFVILLDYLKLFLTFPVLFPKYPWFILWLGKLVRLSVSSSYPILIITRKLGGLVLRGSTQVGLNIRLGWR
jgi:hypothetical protein